MKKTKYETGITTKPSDLLAAKVMKLAVIGVKKADIAKELNTSIGNVNRIIYSERGQVTMREALENIHSEMANRLPSIMESALSELEKIMTTSQVYKTRLEAVKVAIGLTLNLTNMTDSLNNDASIVAID